MGERNIIGFILLYAYVQFLICPIHTVIALLTGKANAFRVTKSICDIMKIKFIHTKNSSPLEKKALYLANHRSWGDFFVDQVVCGGAAYLARYMVILGTPFSGLYAWIAQSTWFFNRKKGIDRNALSKHLNEQWNLRPKYGLIVYPEGTRNQKKEPLKLKTGIIQMAYENNKPVQSVITTNKETIANEKTFSIQRSTICVTSISKPLYPKDFNTFEKFVEACRKQFQDSWDDAYGEEPNMDLEYPPPFGGKVPEFDDLPQPNRAWIVRVIILILIIFISQK